MGLAARCVIAQPAGQPDTNTVVIDFPDQVELRVLIDYVGKTLGLRFIYGEELTNQKVELRPTPIELPRAHLLSLLASLLRVRELAMVEESPGFYRIVRADRTTRTVPTLLPADSRPRPDSVRLVTQVLTVASGDVKTIAQHLASFMSFAKGGLVAVPERGLIIVTEYESRIALLRELVAVLAVGAATIETQTIPVRGLEPKMLAGQVTAILTESHRLRKTPGSPPSVRGDILPGRIVVIGSDHQIEEATALIAALSPEAVDLSTRAFAPKHLGLDRARSLITHVVLAPGSDLTPPAAIYEDKKSGRLFVTAETATLDAVAALLQREDRPVPKTRRPLRTYRPRHRRAGELLGTLAQLLGDGTELITTTPTQADTSGSDGRAAPTASRPEDSSAGAGRTLLSVRGPDYVLTEDEHTNAILAIGSPAFHEQLASLIADLDRRRPQVLIEMTLVAVTMNDSLDLGVELEALDLGDATDFLVFSNFGLSSIDVATGQRTLNPGLGFNGVLIKPDRVPIILRALASKGLARVYSTPKLLVADNAQATLRNVDEAPFTSVNASDTVATTSFAGFESAGTTLSVTPHISEGNHVTLEYELTFSNFTGGSGSAGVPPPRTTNSFTSTVEIPDGQVVVTGGLVVDNNSDSLSEVPLLGRLPLVGWLFQSSSRQSSQTKIFAFIRPTILREDGFEALKDITLKDLQDAEVQRGDTPPGEPMWMR